MFTCQLQISLLFAQSSFQTDQDVLYLQIYHHTSYHKKKIYQVGYVRYLKKKKHINHKLDTENKQNDVNDTFSFSFYVWELFETNLF